MVGRGISVAQLSIISLAKLHAKDPAEIALLKNAASNTGFFYLDLRGDTEGERVLAHLPDVYAVAKKYFAQPEEAKLVDVRLDIKASQDLGWKRGYGGESFEISRDEMATMGVSISLLPRLFQDEWRKFTEINAGCDDICLTLLNNLLATAAVHHRSDRPSDTGLKLVLHPSVDKLSAVGETLHTDSGTLTLLFHKDCSIHAFLPDGNIWAFTPPLEGCALVNVANSLQKLSGGKFHSPKHRVTQPFDGVKDRYYLSYFLRPETSLVEKWDITK
ncbi:Clavaminate synthase-like protein [Stipitochalara longipes BDJ]|nr:Clavaminate synthase-like protein [Stipitochalara longipes BDJ]